MTVKIMSLKLYSFVWINFLPNLWNTTIKGRFSHHVIRGGGSCEILCILFILYYTLTSKIYFEVNIPLMIRVKF